MLTNLNNLNTDTCSTAELLEFIKQTLPVVSLFVKVSQALLADNQNPCNTCEKTSTCQEPCRKLYALIPRPLHGPSDLSNTISDLIEEIPDTTHTKLDQSQLKAIDKIRSDDIFILYKNCPIEFTKQEWRVITLRINEGDTFRIIGDKLDIKTSTASDTFQRARKKMESYYKKQHVKIRKNA